MADQEVEQEICGNCKKEIPHYNYVMHTAHCARRITLCKACKEPVPKTEFEEHAKTCSEKQKRSPRQKTPEISPSNIERSSYYQNRKEIEDRKQAEKRERYLERHEKFLSAGHSMKKTSPKSATSTSSFENKTQKSSTVQSSSSAFATQNSTLARPPSASAASSPDDLLSNGTSAGRQDACGSYGNASPKQGAGLLPCRYCDLELPKADLEEHENYCGTRTDKCLDCGEFVMFKNKQMHLDTDHVFLKRNDELTSKASWDSATQRTGNSSQSSPPRRRRFQPPIYTDFSQFDPTDYLPSNYQIPKPKIEKGESYKEISRRLDCPAPQPPSRRRNPPTELCIPCEFCDTPIPHEQLIEHETGCRPDLACVRTRSRRRRSQDDDDDYFVEPPPSSPEVELPCEFCADMIPASQLLRHQATCD